jgi:hypothetical protein
MVTDNAADRGVDHTPGIILGQLQDLAGYEARDEKCFLVLPLSLATKTSTCLPKQSLRPPNCIPLPEHQQLSASNL